MPAKKNYAHNTLTCIIDNFKYTVREITTLSMNFTKRSHSDHFSFNMVKLDLSKIQLQTTNLCQSQVQWKRRAKVCFSMTASSAGCAACELLTRQWVAGGASASLSTEIFWNCEASWRTRKVLLERLFGNFPATSQAF